MQALYYALGGGHGHVVRGLAVLAKLGTGTLIAPARLAPWSRALGVECLSPPDEDPQAVERWLASLPHPNLIVVDSFPAGVVGELETFLERAPAWLVARWMRPSFYLDASVRRIIETRYERLFWIETPPLELRRLRVAQKQLPPVLLDNALLSRPEARAALGVSHARPLILALGSGEAPQQARILRLLRKIATRLGADLRFAATDLPEDEHVRRVFPASRFVRAADVVVTAGGYHAVFEIAACGAPVVCMPQRRRYDDQFQRVRGLCVARDPLELERALRMRIGRSWAEAPPRWPDGAAQLARAIRARLDGDTTRETPFSA